MIFVLDRVILMCGIVVVGQLEDPSAASGGVVSGWMRGRMAGVKTERVAPVCV